MYQYVHDFYDKLISEGLKSYIFKKEKYTLHYVTT